MLTCIRALALLLLAGLLAGCQNSQVAKLYEGPERPVAEVVTVQIPETLEILSINGQRPSGVGNRLVSVGRVVHLVPGRYQIIAFYKDIWTPSGASTHEVLRSRPVIFDIEGHPGEGFHLEYEQPDTYEAARELAGNFSGWSRNRGSGERVATRPSDVARPSLFSSVVNTSVVNSSAEPATHVAPSDTNTTAVIEPDVEPAFAVPAGGVKDSAYLDMLKAYWSQASQEERREFLRWISE